MSPRHLIVGAVFFDDVDDVLDGRKMAVALGKEGGLLIGNRLVEELVFVGGIVEYGLRECGEFFVVGHSYELGRAFLDVSHIFNRACLGVNLRGAFRGIGAAGVGMTAQAFAIENSEFTTLQNRDRSGVPTGGNEAFDTASRGGDVYLRDCVGVGTDHEEFGGLLVGGQRRRCHA